MDALLVLKSTAGLPVDLKCDESVELAPSQVRFWNALECTSGGSIAIARLNGFRFTADGGQLSAYKTVDRSSVGPVEIQICGLNFVFEGPFNLARDRLYAFLMVLLDPLIYDLPGITIPALLSFYDEGQRTSALIDGEPHVIEPVREVYGGVYAEE